MTRKRITALHELAEATKKKYGYSVIVPDRRKEFYPRINTGLFLLDFALGGGMRMGKNYIFFGDKSSGKTTVAAIIVAATQHLCARCLTMPKEYEYEYTDDMKLIIGSGCQCGEYEQFIWAWYDIENSLDVEWVTSLGIDLEMLVIVPASSIEQWVDVQKELVGNGMIDGCVVDSFAELAPNDEINDSQEDKKRSSGAREMNRAMRTLSCKQNRSYMQNRRRFTNIWIQQPRETMNMFNPETFPHGKQQRFSAHVEIKFWASESGLHKTTIEVGKEKISVPLRGRTGFKVVKSKISSPKIEGSFEIVFRDHAGFRAGQVVDYDVLKCFARDSGLISKEGSKFVCLGKKFPSLGALEVWLKSDEKALGELRNSAFKYLNTSILSAK